MLLLIKNEFNLSHNAHTLFGLGLVLPTVPCILFSSVLMAWVQLGYVFCTQKCWVPYTRVSRVVVTPGCNLA